MKIAFRDIKIAKTTDCFVFNSINIFKSNEIKREININTNRNLVTIIKNNILGKKLK